jgi:tRNA-5-taurinomethyluridine 2-sulfurtransferase
MSRRTTILQTAVLFLILDMCASFTTTTIHSRRPSHQPYSSSSSTDPFESVRNKIPADDVNRWLVQKGMEFDSYRRRFDFGGTWVRNATASVGVVEYLLARGLSREQAHQESHRRYTQRFEREPMMTPNGIVFRLIVDGGRRNTTYELGNWSEKVPTNFNSVVFQDGDELKRRTYWQDARHITETTDSDGSLCTTIRYLDQHEMIVERFCQTSVGEETRVSCKEFFVRTYSSDPSEMILTSPLARVPGCVATVDVRTTLVQNQNETRLTLDGEADAMISRGMLAVLSHIAEQMNANEFLALQPSQVADRLGLRKALSSGRNDGLASMTRTVQSQIKAMLGYEQDDVSSGDVNALTSVNPTVAVLLSGGVDSSVALNLLKRQGYDVTAFYLKIWLEDELAHLGQCPWEDDYRMCQAICAQASVPLEAISLQEQYKDRVISYTIAEANRGRTPNPDIMCNSRVKFGCFYDAIEGRGFDYVASGHYAQLLSDEQTGLKQLLRAPDPVKDQSYFLCALSQQQLSKVLFPIGHLQKADVRELAEEFDLPNKCRPDSQGLCFLGKVKFDEFLGAYLGERPGDIVDAATGEILGRHNGVWYHTVGQRKGIGKVLNPKATSRGPWYVVSKDPARDIVFASNQYDEEIFTAARTHVYIEDIHWISGEPPPNVLDDSGSFCAGRFQMKVRHGPTLVEGSLLLSSCDAGNIALDKKDGGLAPGQFVVFYKVDSFECLGGGVISERHWANFLIDSAKVDSAAATRLI